MKKTLTILTVTMLVAAGCTSTVTLGPKANESSVVGASAGTGGASLTLPLVKAETATIPTEKKKK